MSRPPIIAVSPNAFPAEDRPLYKGKALEYGEASMAVAVRQAGGVPVMPYRAGALEPGEIAAQAAAVVDRCDGLLLSGGVDVDPATYGQPLRDPRWAGDPARDAFEIALYRAAVALGRPVLGVCRGAQLINVAEGGTLWQDLASEREGSSVHRDGERYDTLEHGIELAAAGPLFELFGAEPLRVNSVHHQGVDLLAPGAEAIAWAPDGLVEAFVVPAAPGVLAIQWHPEWMLDRASQRGVFQRFVDRARR